MSACKSLHVYLMVNVAVQQQLLTIIHFLIKLGAKTVAYILYANEIRNSPTVAFK